MCGYKFFLLFTQVFPKRLAKIIFLGGFAGLSGVIFAELSVFFI